MYQYKIHKESTRWNHDTMEDEDVAYCNEKNYRLLTACWSDVNCEICLNLREIHLLGRLNNSLLSSEENEQKV